MGITTQLANRLGKCYKSPTGMNQFQRKPLVIAHRGASGTAPENTLAAVQQALAFAVDGVEVDVQLTKDLVPVVIHDHTVDRTTNGSGRVDRLTWEEIRRLDAGSWFNHRHPRQASESFVGLKVPRLEEVIELTAASRLRLYLDVKYAHWPVELASVVTGLVERTACWDRVVFTSSDHFSLGLMKQAHPDGRIALMFDWRWTATDTKRIIHLAQHWKADEISLHHTLCTDRLIHLAHREGLTVVVWCINQRHLMRQFIRSGVDAIMTNFPGRLQQELAERGSQESPMCNRTPRSMNTRERPLPAGSAFSSTEHAGGARSQGFS